MLPGASIGPDFCIIIDSIKLEMYDSEQLTSYYNHTIMEDTAHLSINWGISRWNERACARWIVADAQLGEHIMRALISLRRPGLIEQGSG